MAYGLRYTSKFKSEFYKTEHFVNIYKLDYTGDVRELALRDVIVDYKLEDWFNPIVNQSAVISVINDSSTTESYYDLMDLFGLEEKMFKVTIDSSLDGTTVKLFDGFLNSEILSQGYHFFSDFQLTASNHVSKLTNVSPTLINEIYKETPINLINESLKLTEKDCSIYVNNTLEPSGGFRAYNTTCFNITALNTELFWEDNVKTVPALEIIENILKPFDSYLYPWNGDWYIERYGDLWSDTSTKEFIAYSPDVSYNYLSYATYLTKESSVYKMPISARQTNYESVEQATIYGIPALNKFELTLNEKEFINLAPGLEKLVASSLDSTWPVTTPRKWRAYQINEYPTGWYYPGYKYDFWSPSIGYTTSSQYGLMGYVYKPGMTYRNISNAIYRYSVPVRYEDGNLVEQDKHRCYIATSFPVTIASDSTQIKISWKFNSPYTGWGGTKNWDHRCWFMLKPNNAIGSVSFNQDGNEEYWEYSAYDIKSYTMAYGSDFDGVSTAELNVNIPIGDVSGWTLGNGDFDFTFYILGEDIKTISEVDWDYRIAQFPMNAYYGDITITVTGDTIDNFKEYNVNNKTLENKSLELDIFDVTNLNYKNGLYTGENSNIRTSLWKDVNDADYDYSLYQKMIGNKFKLYKNTRIKVIDTLRYKGFIKPMSLWIDENDPSTKKYILTNYSYNLHLDEYNCIWWQYYDEDFSIE